MNNIGRSVFFCDNYLLRMTPNISRTYDREQGRLWSVFAIKARENLGATVNLDRFAQNSHSLFKKTKLIRVVQSCRQPNTFSLKFTDVLQFVVREWVTQSLDWGHVHTIPEISKTAHFFYPDSCGRGLKLLWERFQNNAVSVTGFTGFWIEGPGDTPCDGLYGEAPPERGIFFRLQVYKRVGKFWVCERAQKG